MKTFYISIITLLMLARIANAQISYVTTSGSGLQDGTSWNSAYNGTQLQTAINQSGITQVWVAAGTYKPTTGTDRSISFSMKNGVAVYGGFSGNETQLSDRNWVANPTILSGDIGSTGTITDNSNHVIANNSINNTAVLDGFTIRDGYAFNSGNDGYGGGMANQTASPVIQNCSFINNTAFSDAFFAEGGAIFNSSSNPLIANCTFQGNLAKVQDPVFNCGCTLDAQGGAIYNVSGSPQITDCSFSLNQAFAASANAYGQGGSIYTESGNPVITNCSFSNNSTGIIPQGFSAQGGGIFIGFDAASTISNCTFYGNNAGFGGGIFNNGISTINNSVLWGNTATNFPAGNAIDGNPANVTSSIVQGGYTGTGNLNTNPLFVDAPNNNLRLQPCSPAVNAGNNASVTIGITTDLDGNARVQQGTVDMGAYESSYSPPVAVITPNSNIVICSNIPLNLTASGGATYVWSTGETTAIIAASTAGTYTVTATNSNGCSALASVSASAATGVAYYQDFDNDTYGNPSVSQLSCSGVPPGYVENSSDCDDTSGSIHAKQSYYVDGDLDGFGSTTISQVCSSVATSGYSTSNADCNDNDITIWHTGNFYVDGDHDGYDGGVAVVCYGNAVPDGYSASTSGADCNDADASAHAVATWYLDADNDLHYVSSTLSCGSPGTGYNQTAHFFGDCDDNNPLAWQYALLYHDVDHDLYDAGSEIICYGNSLPAGYSGNSLGADCNDNNSAIHDPQSYFVDADLDGFGSTTTALVCSSVATSGYSNDHTDCNDNNDAVNPNAIETCNGIDDDCDFQIDENGITATASTNDLTTFCAENSAVLNASPSGDGFSYQWYDANGIISGETNDSYIADASGTYHAAISSFQCIGVSNSIAITENPLPAASITPADTLTICKDIPVNLSANTDAGLSYQWYKGGIPVAGANGSTFTTGANDANKFKVEETNGFGCSAFSNVVKISRLATPIANVIIVNPTGNPDLCINGKVKLRGNGSSSIPLGYQWYLNSVLISNATSRDYIATTTGSYQVQVTNNNTGCSRMSSIVAVFNSCRAENDLSASTFTTFPNPTDGNFTVNLKMNEDYNSTAVLEVRNVLGEIVVNETVPVSNGMLMKEIQLHQTEASGMYFVRVVIGDNLFMKQIIFQK